MDAYAAIRTKRDSRSYLARPLDEGVKRRILQAGRMAGSSTNRQPYRFIAIETAEQKEALSACGGFMRHVPQAAWVVAIAMPKEHTLFDAGRAAQNMMVAAWAEGIASCPVTTHDTEGTRFVLGLPDGLQVLHAVAFGYPPDPARVGVGRPRKPLAEIVHYERYGGARA